MYAPAFCPKLRFSITYCARAVERARVDQAMVRSDFEVMYMPTVGRNRALYVSVVVKRL